MGLPLRNPVFDEPFLDTDAGQDWLHDSVDTLMHGENVTAPQAVGRDKVLVSADNLVSGLANRMALVGDYECCVEKILIAILAQREHPLRELAIGAVGGADAVQSIARQLIEPHADAYRAAKREDDACSQ